MKIIVHELVPHIVSVEEKSEQTGYSHKPRDYQFLAVDLVQSNSWCQSNLSECLQENVGLHKKKKKKVLGLIVLNLMWRDFFIYLISSVTLERSSSSAYKP